MSTRTIDELPRHDLLVIVHRTHKVEGDEVRECVAECDHPDCSWRFPMDPYYEGVLIDAANAYQAAHRIEREARGWQSVYRIEHVAPSGTSEETET